jgi:uncharacterized protein YdcH (DUF465 family)
MTQAGLSAMTIDQLVEQFAKIGIAQDKALWDSLGTDNYSRFSRLFAEMNDVDNELRSRGRNARLALTQLYTHKNTQVRLKAAKRTLGVAPVEARKIIEEISKSNLFPQAGEAGMTLDSLEQGIFKPD